MYAFVPYLNLNTRPPPSNMLLAHVVSILQGGCFFGALLSAPLSERIGRRKALIVRSLPLTVFCLFTPSQVVSIAFLVGGTGRFFSPQLCRRLDSTIGCSPGYGLERVVVHLWWPLRIWLGRWRYGTRLASSPPQSPGLTRLTSPCLVPLMSQK